MTPFYITGNLGPELGSDNGHVLSGIRFIYEVQNRDLLFPAKHCSFCNCISSQHMPSPVFSCDILSDLHAASSLGQGLSALLSAWEAPTTLGP